MPLISVCVHVVQCGLVLEVQWMINCMFEIVFQSILSHLSGLALGLLACTHSVAPFITHCYEMYSNTTRWLV